MHFRIESKFEAIASLQLAAIRDSDEEPFTLSEFEEQSTKTVLHLGEQAERMSCDAELAVEYLLEVLSRPLGEAALNSGSPF